VDLTSTERVRETLSGGGSHRASGRCARWAVVLVRALGRSDLAEGLRDNRGCAENYDGEEPGYVGAGVDGADQLRDEPDEDTGRPRPR
jgi:hypothetical protein